MRQRTREDLLFEINFCLKIKILLNFQIKKILEWLENIEILIIIFFTV